MSDTSDQIQSMCEYQETHCNKYSGKYEGYSESNVQWAVNITSRNRIYYLQKMHTYLSCLNIVTARIESLVLSGNKLMYACVKEVCCLWSQPRFDTFHQLLITVEALWSQPVLQVGKQVVVAWSEIRALRRVVK
jgi:hypothetical protein